MAARYPEGKSQLMQIPTATYEREIIPSLVEIKTLYVGPINRVVEVIPQLRPFL